MKNSEKIEGLLRTRIQVLAAEIPTQRMLSGVFSALAAVPLILLGIVSVTKPNLVDSGPAALLAAVCGIGLTILIWNIGGNYRSRAGRAEADRERMENMQLCLLAIPEEQIKVSDFIAILSRKDTPFNLLGSSASHLAEVDEAGNKAS